LSDRSHPSTKLIENLWRVVVGLALLKLLVASFKIVSADERVIAQFIPDDGYYYLQLARQFVHSGTWSFDGEVSRTSGFHLLFAYVLAFANLILPVWSGRVGMVISIVLAVLALGAMARLLIRERRWPFLAALAMLLSSPNVALNVVGTMEWPLVVLFAALFVLVLRDHPTRLGWLFFIGLGGALSRSDFGLLPFAFTAAAFALAKWRKNGTWVRPGLSAVAGAATGNLVVIVHTWLSTGHFLQSSSLMKAYWSQLVGHSPWPFIGFTRTLQYQPQSFHLRAIFGKQLALVVVAIVGLAIVMPALRRLWRERRLERPSDELFLVGSVLTLLGYVAFYSHNAAAIQPWYTANAVVPVFLLVAIALTMVETKVAVVLALVAVSLNLSQFWTKAPYPHQRLMYDAGNRLRAPEFEHARIGAWNSGTIGFYRGGRVVNLDGLVNDDIFPYAKEQRLIEYLDAKRFTHLVDFSAMFEDDLPKRGGYLDGALQKRLRPVERFTWEETTPPWTELRIWELQPVEAPAAAR
jgi:hypothetical protein